MYIYKYFCVYTSTHIYTAPISECLYASQYLNIPPLNSPPQTLSHIFNNNNNAYQYSHYVLQTFTDHISRRNHSLSEESHEEAKDDEHDHAGSERHGELHGHHTHVRKQQRLTAT